MKKSWILLLGALAMLLCVRGWAAAFDLTTTQGSQVVGDEKAGNLSVGYTKYWDRTVPSIQINKDLDHWIYIDRADLRPLAKALTDLADTLDKRDKEQNEQHTATRN